MLKSSIEIGIDELNSRYTEKNGVSNLECQNLGMSVLYCR